MQDIHVNPNLVVCDTGDARNEVWETRGRNEREDIFVMKSISEHARSPSRAMVHTREGSATLGGSFNPPIRLNGLKVHQDHSKISEIQSSGPSYFVTEPDSPKGDMVIVRPIPSNINGPDCQEEHSPTSSPKAYQT